MKRTYGQVIASIEDGVTAGDEPLTPTLNVSASCLLNQAGPRLIERDIIPVKPLPQFVPDPNADAKVVCRTPSVTL